jgi:hypothetical protein
VSHAAAYVLGLAPGIAACGAGMILGRTGRERSAMGICIAAVLLSTPIAWLHYFALLIVPLALARPRLSPAWAVPLAMWLCLPTDDPAAWQIGVALSCAALVVVVSLRGPVAATPRVIVTRTRPALAR